MAPGDVEDGGIDGEVQQKTGKGCGCPFTPIWWVGLARWSCAPFVRDARRARRTRQTASEAAWTRLMNGTPAGRIRKEGFTFHGLRASSCRETA